MLSIATQYRHRVLVLGMLLASGCGAPSADDPLDGAPAALEANGARGPRRYTDAELEELAETPAVKQRNEPFAQAPDPSQSLYVTVSDGTRLAVSLYFPEGFDRGAARAPIVYIESWYPGVTVEARGTSIDLYRAAGFVVALGDPRGFGASFGSQPAFLTDRERGDQKEIIAWLASQPWSNGKIVAAGFSISATHAEAMAASGAAGLKGVVLRGSDFDHYANNMFPGGVPNLGIVDFVGYLMSWMRGDLCPDPAACGVMPVDADTDLSLLRAAFRDHHENPSPGQFAGLVYRDDPLGNGTVGEMSPAGHLDALRRAALPARVSASWLDGTTAESALARFAALPGVPMELFIGATTHSGGLDADPFSGVPFQAARPEALEQYAADVAFARRLVDDGVAERKVSYYVLGADAWKSTDHWPPRGVKGRTLHLSRRDLVDEPVRGREERRYRVDPSTTSGAFNRWGSQTGRPVYYGDRRGAPGHRLSFDADPMARDTELVGAPELCLAMRSDRPDGIVLAYLEDVAPDGRVTYLTEGELRLLHRKTSTRSCDPAPNASRSFDRVDGAAVTPGELMLVELPLLPTAALIRRGHHLRLSLAGADAGPRHPAPVSTIPGLDTFPMLTETPATWTLQLGGGQGSSLRLPLRPWARD